MTAATKAAAADLPVAEMVPVAKLKAWVNNPRKNDHVVERVAESIRSFGFASPILARRENGEIIAGHTRLKAAILLGIKEVPVRYLDLDEKQAHMLALADNKLGELAEWDEQLLGSLLNQMTIGEAGLAGWQPGDLGDFLNFGEPPADASPRLEGLTYSVVVECTDEAQQAELLERLESEGFSCKPLVS